MKEGTLSVIIPVYNAAAYLPRMVDSILSQEFRAIELILVDDASTDHSLEICRRYAQTDTRVKVIAQPENGGVSHARNTGLEQATGEYILFVDSDDYLEPDILTWSMEIIHNENPDIFCFSAVQETETKKPLYRHSCIEGKYTGTETNLKLFLCGKTGSNACWNKIVRYDLCDGLTFLPIKYSEDYYFCVQLFSRCQKAVFSDKIGYHYLKHSSSATGKAFSAAKMDMLAVAEKTDRFICENYPALRPMIAVYVSDAVLSLYSGIRAHDNGIKTYIQELGVLRKKFKLYFPIVRQNRRFLMEEIDKGLIIRSLHAYRIFRLSPKLYYLIKKIKN